MLSQPCSYVGHEVSDRPKGRATDRALRVLIVDDNADASDTLAILLSHWGFEATAAHSGHEALQATGTFSPDLVLLDIGMPGMNGFEVARRLRGNVRAKGRVPFLIGYSGYGDEQTRQLSLDAGIDLHLVKPLELVELERLLRRFQNVILAEAEWKSFPAAFVEADQHFAWQPLLQSCNHQAGAIAGTVQLLAPVNDNQPLRPDALALKAFLTDSLPCPRARGAAVGKAAYARLDDPL
jgi:CheY-like chemotaxis protein